MHKRRAFPKTQIKTELNDSKLSPEEATQLDLEVCWCIDHFRSLLSQNKDLGNNRKKTVEQSLKVLQDPSAPVIKKRQIMRQACSDYKSKVKEKKNAKVLDATFKSGINYVKPKVVRYRGVISIDNDSFKCNTSNNFRFDFPHPEQPEVDKSQPLETGHQKMYKFQSSDNSFRFNFQ